MTQPHPPFRLPMAGNSLITGSPTNNPVRHQSRPVALARRIRDAMTSSPEGQLTRCIPIHPAHIYTVGQARLAICAVVWEANTRCLTMTLDQAKAVLLENVLTDGGANAALWSEAMGAAARTISGADDRIQNLRGYRAWMTNALTSAQFSQDTLELLTQQG